MPETDDRTDDRRWVRRLIIIAVCMAVVTALYVIYRQSLRAEIRAKLDEIRKAGYPATPEELNAWYKEVPEAENAAVVYVEAFLHHVNYDYSKEKLLPVVGSATSPKRWEPIPEKMKGAIKEYLHANEKEIELLHKAAKLRRSRYPADFTRGWFGTLLPRLGPTRRAARLLKLDAWMHAEDGRPDLATGSVASALAVGRSLKRYPAIIPHLVRIVCDGMTLRSDGLGRVLTRTQLSKEQLVRLSAAIEASEDDYSSVPAITGERCICAQAFKQPHEWFPSFRMTSGTSPHKLEQTKLRAYQLAGFFDRDYLFFLDMMGKVVAVARLPLPRRLTEVARVQAEVDTCGSSKWAILAAGHVVTRAVFPPLRVFDEEARLIGRLRAARTALGIERFRLKNGRTPAKLSDLVPDYIKSVPEDPFDGKPLRYKNYAKGYVVYSIGLNGVDDGGSDIMGLDGPEDIAFKVGEDPPSSKPTPTPRN